MCSIGRVKNNTQWLNTKLLSRNCGFALGLVFACIALCKYAVSFIIALFDRMLDDLIVPSLFAYDFVDCILEMDFGFFLALAHI